MAKETRIWEPVTWKAAPGCARILRAGSGGIPAASFWWEFQDAPEIPNGGPRHDWRGA